ncbi:MAG: XRE family transcriptional regulator [Rhodopseudomonas sp.]|uniref:helix-turn-helix domain-containing protein n=1 Tax=Rhodopseudomonas sp. TaxID=1078 RepID=UPI00180D9166|nr:XRE family transcriptional regulator [Rhodopseudomonas sp.]NVN86926.1 XRE family transcriptional regulator [Rhodopseudomonas sp.]
MTDQYRTVPTSEVFDKFPAARRARIKKRAAVLIAEELGLQELRQSRKLTQEQVAKRVGGKQVYVSRLEKRGDMKVSTLRDYVKAIGGRLDLVVTFPEGPSVRLKDARESPLRRRKVAKPSGRDG